MITANPILSFDGEHRFLSNFWIDGPLTVDLSGVVVAPRGPACAEGLPGLRSCFWTGLSIEHVFQAAKVGPEEDGLLADDQHDKVTAILTATEPADAKRMGKHVQPLIAGWDQGLKQRVMLACLRAKFAPGTDLAGDLLATGYRMLVEGNTWRDDTWGAVWTSSGVLPSLKEAPCWARGALGELRGENWLGRLLMLVRAELDCGVRS